MARCLIGLGANLGPRHTTLAQAIERLGSMAELKLLGQSTWHTTAAIGGPPGQPAFVNAAAVFETPLEPTALWERMQGIEHDLGRRRDAWWGPRTIDLDLLLVDDRIFETAELTLPHPRMAFRRFVLAPATEIAGEWVHPRIGWTLRQLLEHLNHAPPRWALLAARDDRRQALLATLGEAEEARGWTAVDLAPGAPRPKLVVLVGDEAWQAAIAAEVARRYQGPMLRLTTIDGARQQAELRAALAAMAPQAT